jgi:type II secretory pathway component GspD/PulD (secretin)
MTAVFTFLWMTSKAIGLDETPRLTNPLPVLKGQIGRGPSTSSVKREAADGYAPLNPAGLPGVLFALNGTAPNRVSGLTGTIGRGSKAPARPTAKAKTNSVPQSTEAPQGRNTAFNTALDRLFATYAVKPAGEQTKDAASTAQAQTSAQQEPKAEPKPAPKAPPETPAKASVSAAVYTSPAASPIKSVPKDQGSTSKAPAARTAKPSTPKAGAVEVKLPPVPPVPAAPTTRSADSKAPVGAKALTAKDLVPNPGQTRAAAQEPGQKIVTIDVVDLELSKVIQTLSEQTGINLILLSQASRTLTIRLNKVPLAEALTHISAISGLRHLKLGSTYVVATGEELQKAYPLEYATAFPAPPASPVTETPAGPPADPKLDHIEVLTLSYVTANEVVSVLKAAFDEKELVSRAGPSQHIPSLSTADTQNVTGVSTGILKGDGPEQGGGDGSSGSPTSRVVMLRGTKASVAAARILAGQLDVARPQVAIAVRILDISDDAMKELGLTWNFGDQTFQERGGSGIAFRSFDRSAGAILARISAMEKDDKAKILAQPNISVLDNQKAFILIGQRLNFPTLVGYTQANTPIFSPKEEKVGIYLQVSASVSPAEEITMSLYPQVSAVTSFLEVNGASYPQISTREAQTTLRVQSGETIVLGGLIREEEIKNIQKVPLISQIPIIGELFKRTRTQKNASQIIITITPTVTMPNAR